MPHEAAGGTSAVQIAPNPWFSRQCEVTCFGHRSAHASKGPSYLYTCVRTIRTCAILSARRAALRASITRSNRPAALERAAAAEPPPATRPMQLGARSSSRCAAVSEALSCADFGGGCCCCCGCCRPCCSGCSGC